MQINRPEVNSKRKNVKSNTLKVNKKHCNSSFPFRFYHILKKKKKERRELHTQYNSGVNLIHPIFKTTSGPLKFERGGGGTDYVI